MKINLTKEQCEDIIRVCDNEIISNESFIDDIKDNEEAWIDTNNALKGIIRKINKDMETEQYSTIILQGLTAEQEDYIIEAELEHIRAERELQKDIFNKELQ